MSSQSKIMSSKIMEQVWSNIHENIAFVSSGALNIPENIAFVSAGALIGGSLPILANYLVPVSMSYFGVILPGVGTIHSSAGISAFLQTFSYTSPFYSGIFGALSGIATCSKKFFFG